MAFVLSPESEPVLPTPPVAHILHENPEWFLPLAYALEKGGVPYRDWNLAEGVIDLDQPPPEGVFFNRMSASAHTRGHPHAPDYAAAVLAWLERHGRLVINGTSALRLEMSKVAQYSALAGHGLAVPRTIAVHGRHRLVEAAERLSCPFITKHNRSGKGLGVRLFTSPEALADYVDGSDYVEPVDGITLLQTYIRAPDPFIVRLEFVGGQLLYAVRVDTSGGFELCPADSCGVGDLCAVAAGDKFTIVDYVPPSLSSYESLLRDEGIEVAGIEVITDAEGRVFTYDINVNTNYNSSAEAAAGISGLDAVATLLASRLAEVSSPPHRDLPRKRTVSHGART